ncbi:MAG: hypothetical protein R2851_09155 [Caldilineaceae bacterium]
MALDPLAGKPAPLDLLENIPDLIAHYYEVKPDPNARAEQVSFGTSGHRGTSTDGSFNEDHILAIAQAICDYRRSMNIAGPLMLGMDTHALSQPALYSAIEVFAANDVDVYIQAGLATRRRRSSPTPSSRGTRSIPASRPTGW